jgi:hypothetical protein
VRPLDRCNQNELRAGTEEALRASGLVQVAGGARNTYYGLPGDGPQSSPLVRVGIRTFRLVKRLRLGGTLSDATYSQWKEHYHGKVPAEKVTAWAKGLVDKNMGRGPGKSGT